MPKATSSDPAETETAARLAALRAELAARGLDGFVVPRADQHLGEYVAAASERLAWLTGFPGSAGTAVVLRARAAVFVDGRYTLQVRDQVDGACFDHRHLIEEPPAAWIEAELGAGAKLGYDPWLHSERQMERLRAAAEAAGGAYLELATFLRDSYAPAADEKDEVLEHHRNGRLILARCNLRIDLAQCEVTDSSPESIAEL